MRFELFRKLMPQEEGRDSGGADAKQPEKKDKQPPIEKVDYYRIAENLQVVQQWLYNEVREAWSNYAISRTDEKHRGRLIDVLEQGFKIFGNNRDRLARQVAQMTELLPEERQAIRDLFYFKKLEHKSKFIKNFDFTYYLEIISRALTIADRQIRQAKLLSLKEKRRQRQPEAKQTDLPFDEDIDPESHIE